MAAQAAQAVQEPEALFTAVNFNGLIAELNLPVQAYRVLMMLQEHQDPGGQIVIAQERLGKLLGVSRSSVTSALAALDTAFLVHMKSYGVYQLNPMIAGYRTPGDAWDAIEAMADEMRLDDDDFVKLYRERVKKEESARNNRRRRSILRPVSSGLSAVS
ncbi:MarR family transcriptional regulator [Kitasatospora sp. NPDC092948]|uniref:MarR family transcriptional regulator n=1 Tax=Kitasatospora sp. NPDC092948 TaxID=3364088 RepID=UPI0038226360